VGGQVSIGSALIHAPSSPGLLAIGSSELPAFRIRVMRLKFSGRHCPVLLLSNRSLALMCFRSPQLFQLPFAAVEFVSITPPLKILGLVAPMLGEAGGGA
jgi:hypothetical protein